MFGRKHGASVITQAYIAPGMSVKTTPPPGMSYPGEKTLLAG